MLNEDSIKLYILMIKLLEIVDQRPKTYCTTDNSSEFYTFYEKY